MQTFAPPAHHKINKNMSSIINFNYKGSQISFNNGEKVMVNATQMARPFNKEPKFWLMNQSTTDYLTELSKVRNLTLADLVQVTKGGNNPGTWMHEDVALEFARWLSPAFAIWCNDRIKELLKTGVATVSNDDEAIAYAMQVLNRRLEESKAEKERLEQQNQLQSEQLKLATPKVQYVNDVLQSVNTYTSTQMAKELSMREAEQLHKVLKEKGIMFKQSGQWMLTAKYSEKGYTKPRTHNYIDDYGNPRTNTITVWTERGRAFLHHLFSKQNQSA